MNDLTKVNSIEKLIDSKRISSVKGLISEFKKANLPQSTYFPLFKRLTKLK